MSGGSPSADSSKRKSSGKQLSRESSKVQSPPAVSRFVLHEAFNKKSCYLYQFILETCVFINRESTQKANSFQKSTSQIKHPPIIEEQTSQASAGPETPGRKQIVSREDVEESRSLPCTPRSKEPTFNSTQSGNFFDPIAKVAKYLDKINQL